MTSPPAPGTAPAPRFHCALCGGEDARVLFVARDLRHDLPGDFPVVRCSACRLVAIHPQPDPETLLRHYPDDYYTHRPARVTVKDRLRARGRALLFTAWSGRLEGAPGSALGSFLHALLRRVPPWREAAERQAYDALVPHRGRDLLEIGFGNGAFLDFAARHGFHTTGVDFDPATLENARRRGHRVFPGPVETVGFDPDAFDFVRMRHVLEHVRDPVATVTEVHRILRPGGWFFVEVPNFGSLYARAFGQYWAQIEAPRHLFHFTAPTLHRLLGEGGFEVMRTSYDTQPWHLLASLRYVAGESAPEAGGRIDRPWVSSSLYRLSRSVTSSGLGDNLIVLVRKPGRTVA